MVLMAVDVLCGVCCWSEGVVVVPDDTAVSECGSDDCAKMSAVLVRVGAVGTLNGCVSKTSYDSSSGVSDRLVKESKSDMFV